MMTGEVGGMARRPVGPRILFDTLQPQQQGASFLDAVVHGDRRVLIVVGTVEESRATSALWFDEIRRLLRETLRRDDGPADALRRMNRVLFQEGVVVSMACAKVDVQSSRLVFACAGHSAPWLVRAMGGSAHLLTTPSVALGQVRNAAYKSQQVSLVAGDAAIIASQEFTEMLPRAARTFLPGVQDVAKGLRNAAGGGEGVAVCVGF